MTRNILLTPGKSAQFPSKAGEKVILAIVNESKIFEATAEIWCGGCGSAPATQTIKAGDTAELPMDCDGKPVNITNGTSPNEPANLSVVARPASTASTTDRQRVPESAGKGSIN